LTTPTSNRMRSVAQYTLLGQSGLRVSSLCLGTLTFGQAGWGTGFEDAHRLFSRFLDAGGNFIDTADSYAEGRSEEFIGRILSEGSRDRCVIASKFSSNGNPGDPNAGGNSRKNIYRAVEGSLRRLKTDYIDLYWMHAWDMLTPVGEVISTLDDLIRSGKVRYVGLSDTPAWYLTRAQSVAELRGYEGVAALQLEYSLVERNIEREHVPAALALGLGICAWSPLGGGLLTGKYQPPRAEEDDAVSEGKGEGKGRLKKLEEHMKRYPAFQKFTKRNWEIVKVLLEAAEQVERSPSQVALNWVSKRPGITSTIIGATSIEQLESNLHALSFDLPAEVHTRLEEVGRPETVFPYTFFQPAMQRVMRGDTDVHRRPKWLGDE